MNTTEIVLIDLSSLAFPIYVTSAGDANPNMPSSQMVKRVHDLAREHRHVAICCDSGPSFRMAVSPEYKANRGAKDEAYHHQVRLAKEQLAADGFPVWTAPDFEADDIIASAVHRALVTPDMTVLIISSDKDLLALVGPRVRAMSARDGSVFTEAAVVEKFGVRPDQIRDYLTLVGDSSDNIKGAKGIGSKTAASLLAKFKTVDAIYDAIGRVGPGALGLATSVVTSLSEFAARLMTTRTLVSLRSDVEIPFNEIVADRGAADAPVACTNALDPAAYDDTEEVQPAEVQSPVVVPDTPATDSTVIPQAPSAPSLVASSRSDGVAPSVPNGGDSGHPSTGLATRPQLAVRDGEIVPVEWERQLDPRGLKQATQLAMDMFQARMFEGYGNAQAVLSTIMVGRELGIPAMASLRCINIIKNKHGLSSQIMVAIILKSGLAEYFEEESFDATQATFVTMRKGGRKERRFQYTIEMAHQAGLVKEDSGWVKNPTQLLIARAESNLARLVYPDLLAGMLTPEELAEMRAAA